MHNDNQNLVIIITGHSGCGKSTLSKELSMHFQCEMLNFSYAGYDFAKNLKNEDVTTAMNRYVANCIIAALSRKNLVIVDGLASIESFNILKQKQIRTIVLYIETSYVTQIDRIVKRENVSLEEAVHSHDVKETGKIASGLNEIIALADYTVHGTGSISSMITEAINCIRMHIE